MLVQYAMVFSFSTANREVLEQVIREPRFRRLTELPLFAPMEIALGVGAFVTFAMGTGLYLSGDIHFLVMLFINAFAIYASFTPLHDATHRSASSNRFLNDLTGTICCLLLLPGITTRIYRYLHLEHHRYAGDTEKDPDELFVSASPFALPFILAGLDVHWSVWYIRRWQSRPLGERIEFVACLSFYFGLHAIFLLSPYALEFFLCFMIPQRFGLFYVSWFFAHIQHPEGVEWETAPFQTTVQVQTSRLGHCLMLGQSFHCLHHLAPSIPYYRYRRAWALGEHLFERQGIPTRTLWRKSQNLKLPATQEQTWLSARVNSIETVADEVCAFELVPADDRPWPSFRAGAHIDVNLGERLVRQYSLYNSPAQDQQYRIAVKRDPNSLGGSEYMHTAVEVGSILKISSPRNNFPLRTDFKHYLLIAGGIGVTPLLAMAHQLHSEQRSFVLHIFAHSDSRMAFHSSLARLPFAASISQHCADGSSTTQNNLMQAIEPYQTGHGLYLCGPAGFMGEVMSLARSRSWPSDHLYSETFVPAKNDASENRPFSVKIASSGQVLTVTADEYLIDVLHDHGYPVMCSCTQGICGSCITPVLDGTPEHRDAILTDAQRATNGTMTVCVSRARSEQLVLDL